MSNYPELTVEEYRQKINEAFENVEDSRILRYFYIFIFEKLARIYSATESHGLTRKLFSVVE